MKKNKNKLNENKLICVWNLGNDHSDNVKYELLFDSKYKIKVPICESCFNHHKKIIYLHKQKIDLEVVMLLDMSVISELYYAYTYTNYKKENKNPMSFKCWKKEKGDMICIQ